MQLAGLPTVGDYGVQKADERVKDTRKQSIDKYTKIDYTIYTDEDNPDLRTKNQY